MDKQREFVVLAVVLPSRSSCWLPAAPRGGAQEHDRQLPTMFIRTSLPAAACARIKSGETFLPEVEVEADRFDLDGHDSNNSRNQAVLTGALQLLLALVPHAHVLVNMNNIRTMSSSCTLLLFLPTSKSKTPTVQVLLLDQMQENVDQPPHPRAKANAQWSSSAVVDGNHTAFLVEEMKRSDHLHETNLMLTSFGRWSRTADPSATSWRWTSLVGENIADTEEAEAEAEAPDALQLWYSRYFNSACAFGRLQVEELNAWETMLLKNRLH
ncbi:unnamed protein product [Amoebophrya sp. A120]|nr:unnamed protein product [Amoebophrya sp. A120]|eukprot:GSA120T00000357001.1